YLTLQSFEENIQADLTRNLSPSPRGRKTAVHIRHVYPLSTHPPEHKPAARIAPLAPSPERSVPSSYRLIPHSRAISRDRYLAPAPDGDPALEDMTDSDSTDAG